MDKISRIDWWKINGWVWIARGLLGVITAMMQGSVVGAVLGGGINIVVGIALFQRSVTVFWIVFVLTASATLIELFRLPGSTTPTFPVLLLLVSLILMVMLWQQIRTEKGKK